MRNMSEWVKERTTEKSHELLKGAIDIHVHAGPHLKSSPRSVDPVQAAIQARDAGMRAIVYMDVFEMTTGTAWIVFMEANTASTSTDEWYGTASRPASRLNSVVESAPPAPAPSPHRYRGPAGYRPRGQLDGRRLPLQHR